MCALKGGEDDYDGDEADMQMPTKAEAGTAPVTTAATVAAEQQRTQTEGAASMAVRRSPSVSSQLG